MIILFAEKHKWLYISLYIERYLEEYNDIYQTVGIRGEKVEDMHFLSSLFWRVSKTMYNKRK